MDQGITRLIEEKDLPVFSLELIFATSSVLYSRGLNKSIATYDLMVRDVPEHRNFLLAGGLEAITNFLLNLRYSEEQINYFLDKKRISTEFAEYLKNFKFTGNVLAMPEGTVHFPGEPMLRVEAPLIEANLITDLLIHFAHIDTLALSKLARVYIGAGEDSKVAVGAVRAQGVDAAWRFARGTLFFANMSFSNAAFAMKLKKDSVPLVVGNHAYIKSFPTELEAMRTLVEEIPTGAAPMVDTYDFKQGIKNAVTIAKELQNQGRSLFAICIDSGDLLTLSQYARQAFDEAGCSEVQIALAGNLDEYKIQKLIQEGCPARAFLVVTEVVSSRDSPKLEVVYKLAQVENNGVVSHKAKLAEGKVSLPSKKQVFRVIEDGKLRQDIIGQEDEALGEPLLAEIIQNGILVYKFPTWEESQKLVREQIALLPESYRDLNTEYMPPVAVSAKLQALLKEFKQSRQ